MAHLNVLTPAAASLGCGAARGVGVTALPLHRGVHRRRYVAASLSRRTPRVPAALVLPPDGAAYGVNTRPQETQAVGKLGRYWQQSVGHIGPQHILAFTINSFRNRLD